MFMFIRRKSFTISERMKVLRLLLIVSSVLLLDCFPIFCQTDYLGLQRISLEEDDYLLRWSSKTKSGRYLEEFLKKDESMVRFESKVIVECTPKGAEVEKEENQLMTKLSLQKEQNIVFSFNKIEPLKEGELWIEYVQGNVQGGRTFTLEWNVARIRQVEDRVVFFRYLHRTYKDELDAFMKKVEKKRNEWLKNAADFKLESVNVKN